MNSENRKTSDIHRLRLSHMDRISLPSGDNHVALLDLSIYYTWKNIKTTFENNQFRNLETILNEKFELSVGSQSVSDIQIYFEYILRKHVTVTDQPPVQIHVNKFQNKVTLKIKTPKIQNLLASTEEKLTKDKMDENVSRLDITEMVLLLILISPITDTCMTVVSWLHFFQISYLVSYKYFAIKSYLHRNTFSQFSCIKVRFSDRNSVPFKFNNSNLITLVINYRGIL